MLSLQLHICYSCNYDASSIFKEFLSDKTMHNLILVLIYTLNQNLASAFRDISIMIRKLDAYKIFTLHKM